MHPREFHQQCLVLRTLDAKAVPDNLVKKLLVLYPKSTNVDECTFPQQKNRAFNKLVSPYDDKASIKIKRTNLLLTKRH
jgi:hypothetical protein